MRVWNSACQLKLIQNRTANSQLSATHCLKWSLSGARLVITPNLDTKQVFCTQLPRSTLTKIKLKDPKITLFSAISNFVVWPDSILTKVAFVFWSGRPQSPLTILILMKILTASPWLRLIILTTTSSLILTSGLYLIFQCRGQHVMKPSLVEVSSNDFHKCTKCLVSNVSLYFQ